MISEPNKDLCYFVCISEAHQEPGFCTRGIVSVVLFHFGKWECLESDATRKQ